MKSFRLIEWIKEKILIFFERWTYSKCYNEQEYLGHAVFGMCGGLVGGDVNTNYLSYDCIGCPYFAKLLDSKKLSRINATFSDEIKEGLKNVD